MALAAFNGPRPAPLLPQLQVAALTLAMKGILYIRTPPLGEKAVTGVALLHRLPLLPEVAPPLILMMTLPASQLPRLVEAMAEPYRRFFRGLS